MDERDVQFDIWFPNILGKYFLHLFSQSSFNGGDHTNESFLSDRTRTSRVVVNAVRSLELMSICDSLQWRTLVSKWVRLFWRTKKKKKIERVRGKVTEERMKEGKKKKKKDGKRDSEKQRNREKEKERKTQREEQRQREREKERKRKRERKEARKKERKREGEKERKRSTEFRWMSRGY